MKIRYFLWLALVAFLLALFAFMAGIDSIEEILLFISVITIVLTLPVSLIIYTCVHYRELEEKRRKRLAERRERLDEIGFTRHKQYEVVEVKYLGPGAVKYRHGGLSGALWGGFLGGPIGFVVGAILGSPNPKEDTSLQQFVVKYADGHIEIKELHPNNWEYKKLIKMVKWEEI